MPKKNYTVKEVARLLGFSTNTVYKYLDEGQIKATRLGSEGRFRIPASEVSKLVPDNTFPEKIEKPCDEPSVIVKNAPSLSDWFIGFLSMALGFSQFIFPTYYLTSSIVPYQIYIKFFEIALMIGGFFLISFDILGLQKDFWHKCAHIVLGSLYLILSILFLLSGIPFLSILYFAIFVVSTLTAFKKYGEYTRFIIVISILYVLNSVYMIVRPDSFSLGSFSPPPTVALIPILLVSGSIFFYVSYLAINKRGWYMRILSVLIALFLFIAATIAFTGGFWERAVYAVILASFAVIFPFSKGFQTFTLKSRNEMVGSFVWLFGVFFVGSIVLFFIYKSFQVTILQGLKNTVNNGSEVVRTFMTGNIARIKSFATDKDLVSVMLGQNNLDIVSADEHLKQVYESGGGDLRRVVLVNKEGVIIDTYPYNISSENLDISDREHFINSKNSLGTVITGITQPSSPGIPPSVIVSSPILDDDGNFLGVLLGSIDIVELTKKVDQVKFGNGGKIYLADSSKKYIIASTEDKVLTKVLDGSAISRAVDGKSGAEQSYNASGILSFTAYGMVPELNWGITAEEAISDAFRTYSMTGFIVFLVFVTTGVGSLIFIIYSKRKNRNL